MNLFIALKQWFLNFTNTPNPYVRGGEPAARVNIWYGPHQNFRYSSKSTTSRQNEATWYAGT